MKRFQCAALAVLATFLFSAPALAQESGAKFAMHAQPHLVPTKGLDACTTEDPNTNNMPCSNYNTNVAINTATDMYVVIAQADTSGVAGASFGITYDGTNGSGFDVIGEFIQCFDGLPFFSDTWPDDQSGGRITWVTCQTQRIGTDGVHAVAGAFYVYAYGVDAFTIIPHPALLSGPELGVNVCGQGDTLFPTDDVQRTATVQSGSGAGCNPCVAFCPTPVESATWGSIKSKYADN